jgi:hypothetical protein
MIEAPRVRVARTQHPEDTNSHERTAPQCQVVVTHVGRERLVSVHSLLSHIYTSTSVTDIRGMGDSPKVLSGNGYNAQSSYVLLCAINLLLI